MTYEDSDKRAVKLVKKFFKDASSEPLLVQQGIWKLISALRGPDNEDLALKAKYTSPIRANLMPRTFIDNNGMSTDGLNENLPNDSDCHFIEGNFHYILHVRMAINILRT